MEGHLGRGRDPRRRTHGCAAVALTPGWMRSEMMLGNYGVSEANWRDGAATNPHFAAISESGSQPNCWRYMVEVQDAGRPAHPTGYR